MRVTRLRLTDFRSYLSADVRLGAGLNVAHGPNGAGKTNLLEGLYFGCTGRSCRTSNDRDLVRFGAPATRAELDALGADGPHSFSVGFMPGQAKRMRADGVAVERLTDLTSRPLAAVFLPSRLELINGPPALRRSHLDVLIAALWPARASDRRSYAQALAQRNALLLRIRARIASPVSLAAWDLQLGRHAVTLAANRREAAAGLGEPFRALAEKLGLSGGVELAYRPRSQATSAEEFASELAARADSDLERGFTGHGPHRDELLLRRANRELRAFGSQGEQRLALLALLLAERELLSTSREAAPMLLLDDVMSELDGPRRELLAAELLQGGQSLVTTTDLDHVPGAGADGVTRVAVREGTALQEVLAA